MNRFGAGLGKTDCEKHDFQEMSFHVGSQVVSEAPTSAGLPNQRESGVLQKNASSRISSRISKQSFGDFLNSGKTGKADYKRLYNPYDPVGSQVSNLNFD